MLRVLAPALDLDGALPGFVAPEGTRGPLLAASALAAGALTWQLGAKGALAGTVAYALVSGALRTTPLVSPRAATLELLSRWDEQNLYGAAGPPELTQLLVPLELPLGPWTFEANQLRNSRALDLPAGLYEARIDAAVTEAQPTARVAKLDLTCGELLLERRYLREDLPLTAFPLLLPVGARRLVLSGTGIQGKGVVRGAALAPRFLVPRHERDAFAWPRQPEADGYRAEAAGLRVTALDRTPPDAGAFRVDACGRFVVEILDGRRGRVRVERAAPAAADFLGWGDRRTPLGRNRDVTLEETADQGLLVQGLRLTPVTLCAQGSRITFSGSRGDTSATAVSDASPASLPRPTSRSAPPDSTKK
jgi:hypothetical protein